MIDEFMRYVGCPFCGSKKVIEGHSGMYACVSCGTWFRMGERPLDPMDLYRRVQI